MKKLAILGLAPLAAALFAAAVPAQAQTATKDAAVALVDKAVADVKKKGVEAACKDFADPNGGYIQGELYVFVQDMQAKMICHATNAKMNGKDLSQLKDADGKQFSKAMADLAQSKGAGWVDYQWVNPVTKQIEPKTSYIKRVSDDVFLGVGIYRK
ncbi:cache domain-containing protein [Undibacterium sp. TJN25]|uniref:cache domain-containing protein n=1 Tax=Undibacterium sp. TJN25 TaxID=3413056 RepID=UPI003BF1D9A9